MGIREDWLSCTMRTVEAVMEQHGFVMDPLPQINAAAQESTTTWDKLLRTFNLLRMP
jgi:hypothetical protein